MQDSVGISSIECVFCLKTHSSIHRRLQILLYIPIHSCILRLFYSPNVVLCVVCIRTSYIHIFIHITYMHSLDQFGERERGKEHWIEVACITATYAYRCMCQSNYSSHSHIQASDQASKHVWMHCTRTILCLDWIELVAMWLPLLPLLSQC